jgi:hypothetical protein
MGPERKYLKSLVPSPAAQDILLTNDISLYPPSTTFAAIDEPSDRM